MTANAIYDKETLTQLRFIENENKIANLSARIKLLEDLKIAQELWIFAGEIKDLKRKVLELNKVAESKTSLIAKIKKINK